MYLQIKNILKNNYYHDHKQARVFRLEFVQ
jgi:hypothetical protein